MLEHRRQLSLLLALAVVAVPAVGLRAVCAGSSCGKPPVRPAKVPFCSLPAALRAQLAAGFYDNRSPDVLAAPKEPDVWGGLRGERGIAPAWPSAAGEPAAAVPLVFAGAGVHRSATVSDGTTLASVAPSLLDVLGGRWQNPGVHPGVAVKGIGGGTPQRLVLEVAWKGVGSQDLTAHRDAWPFLRGELHVGAGTRGASTGSLPLDPVATLTTIGTGGLPRDHGITGLYLRNDATGRLTRAWDRGSPVSVISALGDDVDQASGGAARIGLVGTDPSDRGIIGGLWYQGEDDDQTAYVRSDGQIAAARRILATGFGSDAQPDILAVVMQDSIPHMDSELKTLVEMAQHAAGGAVTVVVAGTGSTTRTGGADIPVSRVVAPVEAAVPGSEPAVAGAVAGGIFLDQKTMAQADVTSNVAVQALAAERAPGGGALMDDAFPSFAVSFGKYCAQVEAAS